MLPRTCRAPAVPTKGRISVREGRMHSTIAEIGMT